MALLPVLEMVLRTFFGTGIPGNSGYVQNLTLWVGFLRAGRLGSIPAFQVVMSCAVFSASV